MALPASRDTKKPLNSMTECTVCADKYRDPRILPCIHTYCLKCIQGFCKGKQAGDEVGVYIVQKQVQDTRQWNRRPAEEHPCGAFDGGRGRVECNLRRIQFRRERPNNTEETGDDVLRGMQVKTVCGLRR